MKHHHETKLRSFEQKYPLNSKVKAQKTFSRVKESIELTIK